MGEGGREWESEIVRVRKPLRTAKEPALVLKGGGGQKPAHYQNIHPWPATGVQQSNVLCGKWSLIINVAPLCVWAEAAVRLKWTNTHSQFRVKFSCADPAGNTAGLHVSHRNLFNSRRNGHNQQQEGLE